MKIDTTNYDFFKAFSFKQALTQKYFEGEPLEVGNEPQLFLGDTFVEDVYRVFQEQQTPRLAFDEPIIAPEYPWEVRASELDGGLIYDAEEKLFKAWYSVGPIIQTPGESEWEKNLKIGNCPNAMCYAESEDMIHWRKPMMTHCPIGTLKESNICFTGGGISGTIDSRVFLNPNKEDKANKFLVIYIDLGGPRVASSPDGRVWKDIPGVNPIIRVNFDTHQNVIYDAERKKYLLYIRPSVFAKAENQPAEPDCPGLNYRRRITVSESSDLINWSTPRIVQHARETADLDQCDHQYTFVVGGIILARMNRFRVKCVEDAIHQKHLPWWTFGSDPYNMHFLDRDEPIPDCLSADGTKEVAHSMFTGYPINSGDKTYFPLRVINDDPETGKKKITLHLAEYQENGFVARTSDQYGGWLLTREFFFRGTEFELNCEIMEGGSVTAEVLFGAGGNVRGGQYVEGYRIEDCDPITESGVHRKLSWNGSTDMSKFEGKALYIRLHIVNAKVYAFKVNK